MGLAGDILSGWLRPRATIRRQLAGGVREDRALMLLMLGCAGLFVAQWPRLAREASLDPSVPLEARLGGALLGLMFLAPLGLYALAALSHLVARMLGGQGSFGTARLALFWSLLATLPGFLLHGLAQGFLGPVALTRIIGWAVLAVFLTIWFLSLSEAERPIAAPA